MEVFLLFLAERCPTLLVAGSLAHPEHGIFSERSVNVSGEAFMSRIYESD